MVERLLLLWGRYHEVTLLGGYHLDVRGRGGMHVHHSSARDQLAALNSKLRLLRGEIMARRRHSMRRLHEHLRRVAGVPKRITIIIIILMKASNHNHHYHQNAMCSKLTFAVTDVFGMADAEAVEDAVVVGAVAVGVVIVGVVTVVDDAVVVRDDAVEVVDAVDVRDDAVEVEDAVVVRDDAVEVEDAVVVKTALALLVEVAAAVPPVLTLAIGMVAAVAGLVAGMVAAEMVAGMVAAVAAGTAAAEMVAGIAWDAADVMYDGVTVVDSVWVEVVAEYAVSASVDLVVMAAAIAVVVVDDEVY